MTEAAALTTDDPTLGPPERLHPLYLVTGLGKSVRGAWGLVAGGAVLATQGRWWLIAALAVGMVVVSLGRLLLKWLKLEYRVGAHELRIDSGFLNRTSRAIPFDRITDIDLEQGPIHRLFGLARVRLETGASAGAKTEDGVLDTISLERAEALRDHIRARHGRPAPALAEAEEEPAALFAMNIRRVLTAGFFNFSLAVLAGLFGLSQTVGNVIGFDPFSRSFWRASFDRIEPLQGLLLAHQFVAVIGGSLLLVAVGIGTGIVRTALREHGFRLDRSDTGLRRRRGLLTLTDVSIPAKRVQAAILVTGPIRRAFDWGQLKLQSLAQDGAKGDHVVAPLAHPAETSAILASLGWRATPKMDGWRPVSEAYVTSFAVLMAPALVVMLGATAAFGPIALLSIAVLPLAIAVRWFEWRHTRFALSDGSLFIDTGWWRQRRAIVPTPKIQSIDLTEDFWSRKFGICVLRLGVAGGSGFSAHHIPALIRSEAEALRAKLVNLP
ncbi:MAG: PH domain-containing protein [Sphingomonas sp.]|uniref:PH domain-containing protein n=1 Tax=Sphingomonas sp. TaxID=28214 RepID=UPI001852B8D2|nr:PH domain-containing protein [Sphingomonas sp.]MBA3666378.1 PH domain-containing protein [Sphingomonas sp.]